MLVIQSNPTESFFSFLFHLRILYIFCFSFSPPKGMKSLCGFNLFSFYSSPPRNIFYSWLNSVEKNHSNISHLNFFLLFPYCMLIKLIFYLFYSTPSRVKLKIRPVRSNLKVRMSCERSERLCAAGELENHCFDWKWSRLFRSQWNDGKHNKW